MKVLAVETSCDETGLAVVEATQKDGTASFAVLQSALLSQAHLHAEFGGVYPNLAKREHQKNLPLLYEELKDLPVDAIAVTQGPGLEPALWEGVEFAKKLSIERNLPLLPINHMEGHLISSLIKHSHILEDTNMTGELSGVQLPVLALLISGGHTEFVLMKEWFKYEIIGKTVDDAVGEAFDKVARMLALPYPGGPEISKHARAARESNLTSTIKLPRPMLQSNSCDVSFSGLKTAALYALRDAGGIQNLSAEQIMAFARELEEAIADVLVEKTRRALIETNAQTFVIGGGVSANSYIREKLQNLITKDFSDVDFRIPELSITGDNAIMIAEAALARALNNIDDATKEDFRAVGNLSISSRN